MLVDVFENFRNIYLKTYELDPAKFIAAPRLAYQAASEKTIVKLALFTDIEEEKYVTVVIDMEKLKINGRK